MRSRDELAREGYPELPPPVEDGTVGFGMPEEFVEFETFKIGPPERVIVWPDDGGWEVMSWQDLQSLVKRVPETRHVDLRRLLKDSKASSDPDTAKQCEGDIKRVLKATGYELSARQSIALMNIGAASTWIELRILERDAMRVIGNELAMFMRDAHSRSPDPTSMIRDDDTNILQCASDALRDFLKWREGGPGAQNAAFRVARFVHSFTEKLSLRSQIGEIHLQFSRELGGTVKKNEARRKIEPFVKKARELLPLYKGSVHAACLCLWNDPDPQQRPPGKSFEYFYRRICKLLKSNS